MTFLTTPLMRSFIGFDRLFDEFNIFTVPIDDDRGIRGIRVSPNLYSTMKDIEKFLDAMLKIAA